MHNIINTGGGGLHATVPQPSSARAGPTTPHNRAYAVEGTLTPVQSLPQVVKSDIDTYFSKQAAAGVMQKRLEVLERQAEVAMGVVHDLLNAIRQMKQDAAATGQ